MSRRCHHGSPRHAPPGRLPRRPAPGETPRRIVAAELDAPRPAIEPASRTPDELDDVRAAGDVEPRPAAAVPAPAPDQVAEHEAAPERGAPAFPSRSTPRTLAPRPVPMRMPGAPTTSLRMGPPFASQPMRPPTDGDEGQVERTATAPQLRRFIKSRAYVPMHELRRRFGINGDDDEVTPVDLERTRVFVGLPDREGRLLGELLRGGDIGYELSMDPISPIVVGVYPMRPVTRG